MFSAQEEDTHGNEQGATCRRNTVACLGRCVEFWWLGTLLLILFTDMGKHFVFVCWLKNKFGEGIQCNVRQMGIYGGFIFNSGLRIFILHKLFYMSIQRVQYYEHYVLGNNQSREKDIWSETFFPRVLAKNFLFKYCVYKRRF